MTTEEKAKTYNEALSRAKHFLTNIGVPSDEDAIDAVKRMSEYIFPELKESEDDKVKKIIKASLQSYFDGKLSEGTNDVDYAICLTWLEKQKDRPTEMKSAEESLGISSEDYNKIVDRCIYGVQKLVESDDEKIRKEIKAFIKSRGSQITQSKTDGWLAWLEKQKPVVTPKFRIGDKVKKGYLTFTIEDINGTSYKMVAYDKNSHKGCTEFVTIGNEDKYELVEQKPATKPEINQNLQDNSSRKMFEQKTDDKNEPFKIEAGKWYTCIVDGLAFFAKNNVYYCSEDGYLDQWGKGLTEKPIFINSDSLMKFRPATKEEIPHEPEFKVGDWVIDTTFAIEDYKGAVGQIEEIVHLDNRTLPYYKIADYSQKYKAYLQGGKPISEHYLRDWTIQDAKDGDVLVNWNNIVFIFKAIEDETVKFHIAYNGEKWDAVKTPSTKLSHLGLPEPQFEFHPATKEQRELLFQKIREKGYEWDADRKELKKIEQKTAEWSEEDKDMLFNIIQDYQDKINNTIPTDNLCEYYKKTINWLKSLRPQPKQEWSEEDSNMLQSILDEYKSMTKEKRDWLKSLHPQKQWKPSEEQMELFKSILEYHGHNFSAKGQETMEQIYNGLKLL